MTAAEIQGWINTVATVGTLILGAISLYLLRVVKHATNSLTDRLVERTAISSKAEGVKEEKERHTQL